MTDFERDYGKIIAKNLRELAFYHEKTQAEISRDLNISKATLSSWMNGTRVPRMDKVDLLCNYFNCTRSDIMEDHSKDYYLRMDTARVAQAAFNDPNLRALFDIARDSEPQDIQMAIDLLRRFKRTNPDG